uniref:Uncharacterized protein n=1 Tax=Anguilla anguilla TaxID=7936 RepID=A0A0E9WHZ5_ANGAN
MGSTNCLALTDRNSSELKADGESVIMTSECYYKNRLKRG